ncbi:MAG: hypothetical protein WBF69_07900 [Castellaniella sp.]|uniref:hypothetical protein n=1 Tax=Castellaniella sp. TaxID=1955812 RepID=UPI003C78E18D
MPRLPFLSPIRLLSLSLIVLLSACAQQRAPGYYDTPRDSTVSDARQRAQGDSAAQAPSQLQLGFGGQAQASSAAGSQSDASAGAGAGAAPAASTARQNLPQALADTRTYLGTIACADSGQCPSNRMTLTLAPDGQWRARSTPVDGSSPARATMGCWFLTGDAPVRIVLQSGEHTRASLEFSTSNVLRVVRVNGKAPLLDSSLTRQADLDPIAELASQPAQRCDAP